MPQVADNGVTLAVRASRSLGARRMHNAGPTSTSVACRTLICISAMVFGGSHFQGVIAAEVGADIVPGDRLLARRKRPLIPSESEKYSRQNYDSNVQRPSGP
jgi:hypothetical protein